MTLYAQKHHNCPSCTCTDPLPDNVADALSACPELGVQAQGFDEWWMEHKVDFFFTSETFRVMAQNAFKAGQAQGGKVVVKVKPLVWDDIADGKAFDCDDKLGLYRIFETGQGFECTFNGRRVYSETYGYIYDTPEQAKAAAYEHNQALILAEIEDR